MNGDDGMTVDVPEEDDGITMLPEGGALIADEDGETSEETKFDANLAESLSDLALTDTATELLRLLENDTESRKKRDEMYEEGLRRTGVDGETTVGADFYGASKAVHPILIESAIEFNARAIKELFPANGPVKSQIIGEVTDEKMERAERKKKYLNWQCTKQMPEYRPELEQLLTQCALAGSQYSKVWRDKRENRNRFEFIPSYRIILPFAASSFRTAKRKAEVIELTRLEVQQRIDSGMYIDFQVESAPAYTEEVSGAQKEAQKIEGKEETGYNEDGLRKMYEVYVWWSLEDDTVTDGEVAPYIITIDDYTRKVVACYRNWEEGDEHRKELDWIVEWPFIPFLGSSSLGLVHVIGTLAVAATGSLNGLLDSAHVNNIPTAIALKGSKITGQTKQLEPTTIQEIEGPAGVDDIRKLAMTMPYNPPSTVLFQLLGWLTDAAKGTVTTASEKIADASNTGPVGTTYALIEQGAQIFSSIHARLHNAQSQVLEILCRLNGIFLNDQETVEELGELIVSRKDFQGPQDICPVSDPNIFCETQRWAQLQEVFKLSQDQRVRYDAYRLHERALQLLKFPQPDEVLPPPKEAEQTNPVAENVNAASGVPIKVFPEEDHMAHLDVHLSFSTDPSLSTIAAPAVQPLMGHVQQHLLYLYASIATKMSSAAAGEDITQFMTDKKLANQVDGLLAAAVPHVHEAFKNQTQKYQQSLMQLAQLAQQMAQGQQPPLDPASQVALKIGQAEVARKAQADQANQQLKATDQQADQQNKVIELQTKAQREQAALEQKAVSEQQKMMTDLQKTEMDLRSKMEMETMKTHISSQMEQMKADQKARNDLILAHLDKITQLQIAQLSAKVDITKEQIAAAQAAESAAFQQAKKEGGEGEV